MATTLAWSINVPLSVAQRATREGIVARIRQSLDNARRFTVLCVEAETRTNQAFGIGPARGIMVAMIAVDNALTNADYVMLDSIAFGAFKATTRSAWSVNEIRGRLNPTGSDTSRSGAILLSEVGTVSRTVTDGASCNLSAVRPMIGQRQAVVSGAPGTVGVQREPAPLQLPDPSEIPTVYKVAGVAAATAVAAIAVAYVVRSFK